MHCSLKSIGLFLCCVIVLPGCAAKKCGPCAGRCPKSCKKPCGAATNIGTWGHFGKPMKLTDRDTLCTGKVLSDTEQYAGKFIRIQGKVASVCANRGCWIRLGCKSTDETLFVKFTCPMKGRLVPMEAVGHRAVVEGTLELQEISEEEARHYKEDAGASPEEIAKIVGPQKITRMKSPAALIEGVSGPAGSTK